MVAFQHAGLMQAPRGHKGTDATEHEDVKPGDQSAESVKSHTMIATLTKTHSDRMSLRLLDITDLQTSCHTGTDSTVAPTDWPLIII